MIDIPNPTWCGTQRFSEFAMFTDRLLKHEVRSLVCIGIGSGGNQWYLANRYHAANEVLRMTCIDVQVTEYAESIFRTIRGKFPGVEIATRIANSQHLAPDDIGMHDAGFVDGDHGEPQALHDGELLLAVCSKLVGFHDINPVGWPDGIPSADAWIKTREGRDYEELIGGEQYGIGIVYQEGIRSVAD